VSVDRVADLRLHPADHASDGALLRLLDGEAGGAERSALLAHVAGCDACRARQGALAADAAAVREALSGAPAAPAFTWADVERRAALRRAPRRAGPAPRAPAWAWRAAAALLLAAGVAAAAPAVGRWARARLGGGAPAPAAPAPVARPAAPPAAGAAASAVAFAPAGDEVVVSFEARQAVGTLELVRAEGGDAVRATVLGDPARARLLVLPGELHVRNAGADASYRVAVPEAVRRVRVRVAGAEAANLDAAALRSAPARVDLAR
jgi:hypothetical protein